MGGFDIKRASVNLNNAPGAIAGGNAQAIARFEPYHYRDQAGEMIKGIGRALDTAVKAGSDFIDAQLDKKDKSDLAAMRSDYDKAMGAKMNDILARNNNDLAQVKPDEYEKASKEVTDALVKQYKPMARTMHQFNAHRGQAEASGGVRIDGAVKRANENIYQARLAGAEQSALERHTAEQSTTSLENYWQAVYTRNERTYGAEVANQMANSAVRAQVVRDKIIRINATDSEEALNQYATSLDSGKLADAMDKIAKEAKEQGKEPDFSKVNEMGQILYKHNALRPDKEENRVIAEAIDRRRKIIRAEKEEEQRQARNALRNAYSETDLRVNNPNEPMTEAQLLKERDAVINDTTTYAGNLDLKKRVLEVYQNRLKEIKMERAAEEAAKAKRDELIAKGVAQWEMSQIKDAEARQKAQEAAGDQFRKEDEEDIIFQAENLRHHQGENTPEVMNAQAELIARINAGQRNGWIRPEVANRARSALREKLTRDEKNALRRLDEAFNISWTTESETGRLTNIKHAPKANIKWIQAGAEYDKDFTAEDYSTIRMETLKRIRRLPDGADKGKAVDEIINNVKTGFALNRIAKKRDEIVDTIDTYMTKANRDETRAAKARNKDAAAQEDIKKKYYDATRSPVRRTAVGAEAQRLGAIDASAGTEGKAN